MHLLKLALLLWLARSLASSQELARGSITGMAADGTGSPIAGAHVTLQAGQAISLETSTNSNGEFTFSTIVAGSFRINISAPGFSTQTSSGVLQPGEALNLPRTVLQLAPVTTDVQVTLSQAEVAEEQIKVEEKQRLLAFIPNFNVTYLPHPEPLTSKQKFELALKMTLDPATFAINGVIAGVQQKQNDFSGFGQGAQGYAKRFGASYASFFSASIISDAALPSLFKQDPRYYFKGTGSKRSRFWYAVSRAVICQGDNGRPQVAYSRIVGELAAGGLSNLYYPAKNRNGAGLTFGNAAIGIAAEAAANLFQEFVARALTPKKPPVTATKP